MNISLIKIKQKFKDNKLSDLPTFLLNQLSRIKPNIRAGSKIAIGLGSRGISNLPLITKTVVDYLKDLGAHPFIFPAMGSHGGAKAEGQIDILRSYGITQQQMNVPISATMEVIELPSKGLKNRVFMNKLAYESDGIVLINRIKPHTDYHSSTESGLIKMSVIGIGNHSQALEIHKFGVIGLKEMIPKTAEVVLSTNKIIGGIALVEDAYKQAMVIKVLLPEEFFTEEPPLLRLAKKNMPSLPCKKIDVLIIKEMGKNFSGVGIDSNIIGRIKIRQVREPDFPKIQSIVVTDISDESHGNALGVGLSDVITRRLFDKIDFTVTRENVKTSSFLERGKIPIVAETDQEAFEIAWRSCGCLSPDKIRVVCIQNTLNLDELYISESIFEELKYNRSMEKISAQNKLFNKEGQLIVF
jgi:hypothetical protein